MTVARIGLIVAASAVLLAACDGGSSSQGTVSAPVPQDSPSTVSTTVAPTANTTTTTAPTTTTPPVPPLQVIPYGARSELVSMRVRESEIESVADDGQPGDVVLTYAVDVGIDTEGRSGTILWPEFTTDGQLAIDVKCDVGCPDFVPINDFRQISMELTVSRTGEELLSGAHSVPFLLRFDDGVEESFDIVLWAEEGPSASIADAVVASQGPPELVQTVFTGEIFAYHAISAFGSIWVLNRGTGTVSRIDATNGELLATISVRDVPVGGTFNRLTATDEAAYATGSPVVRIDPATNELSEIDGGANTAGIIADSDTVWAASLGGTIVRIDPDQTTTELSLEGRWVDLAISNGLIWALEQSRGGGRPIAFDGVTGEIVHELVVATDINGFAVRLVADDRSVVVGVDTSGGGGRTGQVLIVDPTTGVLTETVPLESRPEGIVLTPNHIWTSGAVLDRDTLEIVHTQQFGFTITQGPDGSIWGTGGVPRSGAWIVNRYSPGDLAG